MSFNPGLLYVLKLRSIRGVRFLLGPGEDVTVGSLVIGCFSGVPRDSFGVTERVVGGSLLLPELEFVEMISGDGLLNAHSLMNLRFLSVTLFDPNHLMRYCLLSRYSTILPCFSHFPFLN